MGVEERSAPAASRGMPEGIPTLIVRPSDGHGRVGRELQEIVRYLRANDVEPTVVQAPRPGQGIRRARAALSEGVRFLVSVGGDALAREVVAAVMEEGAGSTATLSVLGAGSGCDFVRTFGLPADAEA